MRIIRFLADDGRASVGEDHGDGTATILAHGSGLLSAVQRSLATGRSSGEPSAGGRVRVQRVLAPILPRDILCVGCNYHPAGEVVAREGLPELELFMKPSGCVQDPGGPILIPLNETVDWQVDVEGELAVIIGAEARAVEEKDALQHVLGYTIANDVTARRWQRQDIPMAWMRGKAFDTFCPLGPVVVTADEIADVQSLAITTSVNGRVIRQGSTSRMIRSVARLISEISARVTLRAGSILLTGAPPLNAGEKAQSLYPSDVVVIEIERLGRLMNRIEGR